MKLTASLSSLIGLAALTAPGLAQQPQAPPPPMSFFTTSIGLGDGAKLGGLSGADAHCQKLAAAAGRGAASWRAYLSQAPGGGLPQVNARDRIGQGPWYNAAGVVIAWNLEDLHEDRNNVRKYTALDEKGAEVKGRGDDVNHHDMLTGSDSTGRLIPGDAA
ncbi:MAG: lectin, partial [Vicinamibacteria bacterium]|nr:lectin [Vicinamibacteria bacterium]